MTVMPVDTNSSMTYAAYDMAGTVGLLLVIAIAGALLLLTQTAIFRRVIRKIRWGAEAVGYSIVGALTYGLGKSIYLLGQLLGEAGRDIPPEEYLLGLGKFAGLAILGYCAVWVVKRLLFNIKETTGIDIWGTMYSEPCPKGALMQNGRGLVRPARKGRQQDEYRDVDIRSEFKTEWR